MFHICCALPWVHLLYVSYLLCAAPLAQGSATTNTQPVRIPLLANLPTRSSMRPWSSSNDLMYSQIIIISLRNHSGMELPRSDQLLPHHLQGTVLFFCHFYGESELVLQFDCLCSVVCILDEDILALILFICFRLFPFLYHLCLNPRSVLFGEFFGGLNCFFWFSLFHYFFSFGSSRLYLCASAALILYFFIRNFSFGFGDDCFLRWRFSFYFGLRFYHFFETWWNDFFQRFWGNRLFMAYSLFE